MLVSKQWIHEINPLFKYIERYYRHNYTLPISYPKCNCMFISNKAWFKVYDYEHLYDSLFTEGSQLILGTSVNSAPKNDHTFRGEIYTYSIGY